MVRILLCLTLALPGLAHAGSGAPLEPITKGTKVTLGHPTQPDEVLLRLVGLQCVADSNLERNRDGSFAGSVECGVVTIQSKRLAIDLRDVVLDDEPGTPQPPPAVAGRRTD